MKYYTQATVSCSPKLYVFNVEEFRDEFERAFLLKYQHHDSYWISLSFSGDVTFSDDIPIIIDPEIDDVN